ncbi:YrhK family protein [Hoeflea sp. WL0058]|uniref:YrhK family protein n=1 Tax=Flavimaribacter sediminis TaxID=2865987 RepID=A0AAE2ZUI9_9HYPH|nr:YrhK family protein [Flavimaribacter sediminis]MBW8640648.1 YrhK family protein [Flavimaribacter sediminis]
MPHLFVNRPRLHDLFNRKPSLRDQFRWETINAIAYKFGGVLFIAGSIMFFPSMEAYAFLGALIFVAGSLVYLLVTGHDLYEVLDHIRTLNSPPGLWDRLELWSALTYVTGTILFTVGSILFLPALNLIAIGASCFVIGSLLFVVGATINVLEIVKAEDMVLLQLMNLTALTFVTGSVLFTVASIPYLLDMQNASDRVTIDAFLAWQYVAGSCLFLAGGVFNYWRACIVMRRELQAAAAENRGSGSGTEDTG